MKKLILFLFILIGYNTYSQVKVAGDGSLEPVGTFAVIKNQHVKGSLSVQGDTADLPDYLKQALTPVYQLTDSTFYQWKAGLWTEMRVKSHLIAGNNIVISGDTVSTLGNGSVGNADSLGGFASGLYVRRTELIDSLNSLNIPDSNSELVNDVGYITDPYDGDSSATNELQDVSTNAVGTNVTITISNGTGDTFTIDDGDSDPQNERDTVIAGNGIIVNQTDNIFEVEGDSTVFTTLSRFNDSITALKNNIPTLDEVLTSGSSLPSGGNISATGNVQISASNQVILSGGVSGILLGTFGGDIIVNGLGASEMDVNVPLKIQDSIQLSDGYWIKDSTDLGTGGSTTYYAGTNITIVNDTINSTGTSTSFTDSTLQILHTLNKTNPIISNSFNIQDTGVYSITGNNGLTLSSNGYSILSSGGNYGDYSRMTTYLSEVRTMRDSIYFTTQTDNEDTTSYKNIRMSFDGYKGLHYLRPSLLNLVTADFDSSSIPPIWWIEKRLDTALINTTDSLSTILSNGNSTGGFSINNQGDTTLISGATFYFDNNNRYNHYVGANAGKNALSGNSYDVNIGFGSSVMRNYGGFYSTAFGSGALQSSTTYTGNYTNSPTLDSIGTSVAFGAWSGRNIQSLNYSTFIGSSSGYNNTNVFRSTFIGENAGSNDPSGFVSGGLTITPRTYVRSIGLGNYASALASGDKHDVIAIGFETNLYGAGKRNIFLGTYSGYRPHNSGGGEYNDIIQIGHHVDTATMLPVNVFGDSLTPYKSIMIGNGVLYQGPNKIVFPDNWQIVGAKIDTTQILNYSSGGGGGANNYISNVSLVGTDLTFTGIGSAFNSTVNLTSLEYTDFDTDFTAKSTTDLSEGTNLYYTDTRVNSAIDTRVTKQFVEDLDLRPNVSLTSNRNFTNSDAGTEITNNSGSNYTLTLVSGLTWGNKITNLYVPTGDTITISNSGVTLLGANGISISSADITYAATLKHITGDTYFLINGVSSVTNNYSGVDTAYVDSSMITQDTIHILTTIDLDDKHAGKVMINSTTGNRTITIPTGLTFPIGTQKVDFEPWNTGNIILDCSAVTVKYRDVAGSISTVASTVTIIQGASIRRTGTDTYILTGSFEE